MPPSLLRMYSVAKTYIRNRPSDIHFTRKQSFNSGWAKDESEFS